MPPPQSAEKSLQQIRDLQELLESLTRSIEGGTPPTPYFEKNSSFDAFGRLRISDLSTIIDSKLLHDKNPLLWSEDITDTSGNATSVHSTAEAAVTMHAETDDVIIRQTRTHYNYQPGKSQLVLMTGTLGPGGAGVTCRIGVFQADDGLFFEQLAGALGVILRNGAADTRVEQAAWNLDTLDGSADGNNPSGIALDQTKAQIFLIDFEWLAVGRVRFGFQLGGAPVYVHEITHVNTLTAAYMATPNLPLRYEIRSTDATAEMKHICSTVMSEGGREEFGIVRTVGSTAGVHIDANAADQVYAMIGVRLKSTHLDVTARPIAINVMAETGTDFEWMMLLNPTVGAALVFAAIDDSGLEVALGDTTHTIADDAWEARLSAGFAKNTQQSGGFQAPVAPTLALGSAVDGTRDVLVLAVRPLAANADIQGTFTMRELF